MRRRAALGALLLAAWPAAAYVLPAPAVLKRVAQKREEQALQAIEVQGTLAFFGEPARQAAELGLSSQAGEASAPAFLVVKVPGRCRVEAVPPDAAPAERPFAAVRGPRLAGQRGLERIPAALALVQGVCALLAVRVGGPEPEAGYAAALGGLGVSLAEVSLARAGGRVAYVLGGRARDDRPLAWVDKVALQPVRLAAQLGGARHEVRLLDWGSPTGGDRFPRAVEVHGGGQLLLRFTTEKVVANPRVPDALFP
ncbi:MAG TPA: hypothetical protein VH880_06395 [Anaeromyxobacteraceae bacterium]